MAKSQVSMKVNGKTIDALVEPRTLAHSLSPRSAKHYRPAYWVRNQPLRRLHRRSRRQVGEVVHGVCRTGQRIDIRTIEGMANADGTMHALQEGFREMHGLQCGFCTPGMIMRAYRLLQENANPSEEEIRYGISGNLCRCTGYQNIVKAIQFAAAKLAGVPFQEAAE